MPDAYLTASHELLEQIRYYPRTSTTVLNAYVGPIISGYMEGLDARLAELRFGGVLLIMQSNGGVATPRGGLAAGGALAALRPGLGPDRGARITSPTPRSTPASRSTWAAPASTSRWSSTGAR